MCSLTFQFSFRDERWRNEAFDMLSSLWQSSLRNSSIPESAISEINKKASKESLIYDDPEALNKEDWDMLLQGAKLQSYPKDTVIVQEGDNFQRIYQIVEGVCRIEKGGKRLGQMVSGQTFGEISFLLSGGASASVIAESENVEVYILEGYFINILFGRKPELAGRFYKYLADSIQRSLRSREN